jgi:hypothetical protein
MLDKRASNTWIFTSVECTAYFLLIACLACFQTWIWNQYVPQKHKWTTGLHCIIPEDGTLQFHLPSYLCFCFYIPLMQTNWEKQVMMIIWVNYWTTCHHITGGSTLRSHHCENLKSNVDEVVCKLKDHAMKAHRGGGCLEKIVFCL